MILKRKRRKPQGKQETYLGLKKASNDIQGKSDVEIEEMKNNSNDAIRVAEIIRVTKEGK